ncbi:MAG: carboxypeptidase-like regulatory domain-containing protein, partial [Proteiniphilum sp.]|nr:carboxypeptidase-like regulatory domain-containing protein [Proteiniphilum sp.]
MNEKQFKNVRIPNRKFNCGVAIVLLIFSMIYTDKMYANESLSQQNKKQVVGKVIDMNGDPLPGTTITIDGTTSGVITDGDGNFKLDVEESDVLVVSFIGMETQEIPVAGKSSFTIVMQEAASELDEVTVVAFATQKKESVISSISTVRPSELKTPTSNLTTALGGRI